MVELNARAPALPDDVPLDELDKRYFAYTATLEPPLNELALDRRVFIGGGESRPITSLQEVHPYLVTCIPWFFNEAFPSVLESDLLDIAEAGALLILALYVQDHCLDGQLPSHPGLPLLHQWLHTAALRKFHALFEASSPFWSHFDRYLHQYMAALLQETYNHCGQVTTYSLEEMWQIGVGKIALFKAVTTALALKASAEAEIPHLDAAIDAMAAALQLGDDIMDWKDDYRRQNYTLPLTQAIPAEQWPAPTLSVKEVDQRLGNALILETLSKRAIDWFEQALDAVAHLHCSHWVAFIEDRRAVSESYREWLVAQRLIEIIEGQLEPSEPADA
jgi:hypothetical protein